MHKSRLGTIVIDCQTENLNDAADFWQQALGKTKGAADDKYVCLDGKIDEPRVLIQKVNHQSRIHIDIETDDIDAEVRRLQQLGATVVKKMEKWVVMQAPTKQRFCIINQIRDDFDENANCWD